MTQPDSFNDWSSALRMKEVIAKFVREEMDRQRPPARYGKVVSFNRFNMTARVLFPGDVETTSVKFPVSLQPTRSIDLVGDLLADVARVDGVPGNLWITEIVSGPVQSDSMRLNSPRLMGGDFMHQVQASYFSIGTSDLPGQDQAWYVGRWKNDASFAADGLATVEIVIQQTLFCAITKYYQISIRSDDTSGNWKKAVPTRDSGPWSSNDFELEIKCTSSTMEFRVRRSNWNTGGFTPAGYDFSIWFHGQDWEQDSTAPESITSDPAPGSMIGTTSAEGKGPFYSPAMNAPSLGQNLLLGGGAITYNSLGILKWTRRFIVMGLGRNHLSPSSFFDIPVPVGSVTVPVYSKDGTTSTSTVAGGVWLADWEALYYEIPWGASNSGLETNFRIVSHDPVSVGRFQVPSHWILVGVKSGDTVFPSVRLGTGETISTGPTNLGLAASFGAQALFGTPAYQATQGNRVELEGVVSTSIARTAGVTVATLPTHMKPSISKAYSVATSAGNGRVDVQSSGAIILQTALGAGAWFSLDGISFARGS